MLRIEPGLIPVVTDLERGMRELGVQFGVIGALVPELLLDARPLRMTNDADVMVIVTSLADFETLKSRLATTISPARAYHIAYSTVTAVCSTFFRTARPLLPTVYSNSRKDSSST